MNIHITSETPNRRVVEENAKKVGLDLIPEGEPFSLYKTGAKNSSPYGYADEMFCERGVPVILGNGSQVAILVENQGRWFRTSPIVKCEKDGDVYKIETKNSFYELRHDN